MLRHHRLAAGMLGMMGSGKSDVHHRYTVRKMGTIRGSNVRIDVGLLEGEIWVERISANLLDCTS